MSSLGRSAKVGAAAIALAALISAQLITIPLASAQGVTSASCPQPPNNVDHAAFTAAELDMYGLPPYRPGQSLSQWQRVVRAAKTRICTGKSLQVSNHPQMRNRLPSATIDEGSNNWAGYIAINGGYQEAFGFWNVPCLTLLLKTGYSNAWIGLGGDGLDGGGNLLQAGSESDEYRDAFGRFVARYYAWYEDVPNQPTEQFAFSVNCGDQMYADIYQYSSPIHMVIEDTTTGTYADKTNTNFSNGSTAEWIVERPAVNNTLPGLADFNYVAFQGCKAAQNGAYVSLIDLPHNYSNMYGNNNTTVPASPGSLSVGSNGTNFNVNWWNFGP